MTLTFRSFTPQDTDPANLIQQRYLQAHPGAQQVDAALYLSPYFAGGKHVMVAVDGAGEMAGYAPYFPQGEVAWVEIRVRQGFERARGDLLAWLLQQARAGGQTRLCFQYLPHEQDSIAFAASRGGRRAYSIYSMQRQLAGPLPEHPLPPGYRLEFWRMTTQAEQEQYLAARNACFPEALTTLEAWQYFTASPQWHQGCAAAAFAGDELAASALLFWSPGSTMGLTEVIFTLPAHRSRGLARAVVAAGLHYLQAHGLQAAGLEVKAGNETALRLYLDLGYEVCSESQVYQIEIAGLTEAG